MNNVEQLEAEVAKVNLECKKLFELCCLQDKRLNLYGQQLDLVNQQINSLRQHLETVVKANLDLATNIQTRLP